MGSPLGPLMANTFMCHLEDKVKRDGMIPEFYKRFVDDALSKMPNAAAATVFLEKLNDLHPNLSFTMEPPVENKIPFVGMEISRDGSKVKTKVFENLPTLVCFHTSIIIQINVTKKAFLKPWYIAHMLFLLPEKPLIKNVRDCVIFSPTLIILLVSSTLLSRRSLRIHHQITRHGIEIQMKATL
jgi:hypothetical protein